MSEAATGPVRFTGTSDQVIDWLQANGVQRVRVEYCDYGGRLPRQGDGRRAL